MQKQKIAIVGLGRVGGAFLEQVIGHPHRGVELSCAVEIAETEGKKKALAAGVTLVSLEELVAKGESVDVIFDLTGLPEVRHDLRTRLLDANNNYTIIASESIAKIIWSYISDEKFLEIEGRNAGY